MTTPRTTPAGNTGQASTKHHVVNGRFAALLEEDFGIEWATVVEALIGEPQKQAIAICAWAERTEQPAKALLAWSRKHRKGTHRPRRRSCRRPSDTPAHTVPRPRTNRSGGRQGSGPRRSEEVGSDSLRGILADPDRLAQTAERMGV